MQATKKFVMKKTVLFLPSFSHQQKITMKKNSKKTVVLITGYLGSGKTTLLNNLLRQEKLRTALIVNDMGSINVDAEIFKKNGSNVTERPMFELQNGCICCTLREEFIQQIEKISNPDTVDVVFVEASGISDPDAVNASFLSYEEDNLKTKVYLTSVVTVVDADRIYREFLKDMEFQALCLKKKRPFNRERFMNSVNNNYPKKLTLAKGYIWFSDADANVQLFEQAARNSSVMTVAYWIDALEEKHKQEYLEYNPDVKEAWDEEFGDRVNQLVIIGKGYNKEAITAALKSCLDEKAIA